MGASTRRSPWQPSSVALPPNVLTALDAAVKTTDFDALRARKFTGECPVAFDGQEFIYEFGAPGGTERIATCETEVDPNDPLFVAVTAPWPRSHPSRAEQAGLRRRAVPSSDQTVSCYSHIASYERQTRYCQVARNQRRCPRAPSLGARPAPTTAESIRLELAEAWGEMGAAWGVTPAIARVQAYLMARQEPLTEREVREALGLSHRAASLALAEAESWGIVERVPEPRRVGRRGPAGVAYLAVGDHFQWFGRVIAERKVREGDPVVAVLEQKAKEAGAAAAANPDDGELADLRDWLASFVVFVRLFDRAVGLIPQLEPRELERSLQLLDRVPDATILRLFDLLGGLDDDDVLELVEALSRLSPTAARRATKLMSGVVRTVSR